MSGRVIKADDKITLKAPTYNVNTNHYFLVNPPPFNNANTQIMSRNTATGEMQLVDRNSSDFTTDITNAGIHAGLVTNPGFASSHSIKSIAAGSNINVTPGIDHITISTPLDGNITQTNRGTGSHILHDPGTDSSFSFKSLIPGTNMSLSSNDDEITINTTLTGFVSLNNLGAGEHVLADPGTDEYFNFKTIVAGSNITVASDANTITISNPSGSSITQNNLGAGEPLLVDPGTDTSFSFKTLVPGTNTTISSDANTITIGSTLTGNITQSNLGAGTQILSDPGTDNAFAFKTLVAGSNVTLSNDANTVTIAVPTATGTITQSNLGVGAAILSDPGTDNSFAFKTLKGGPNISLSTTANDITIINQLTGEITQTNVGTGSGVLFDTGTSNTFHYKSINAGSNITVTNDPDNIYISTPLDGTITQHNAGSGLQVLKDDGTFSTFNFKTLVAGSGITLTPSTDEITIANSGSLVNVNLTNLGAGQPILTNPGVNSSFAFNTISAGTGILLTPGVGEIIISNDGSAVNVSLDNQTLAGEAILFDPGLNSTFHFKTLLAGTGISLGSDNDSVTISTNGLSTITQSNRGAGTTILYDPATANAFSFKTLVSGSHITMSTTNDEITIGTDLTGNITQNNLGAGEGILVGPGSHSTFGFKSLVAGSNVTLVGAANEITISATSDGNITQSNLGAGIPVLSDPGTDSSFAFRTLVAGTNTTISNDANTVTIGSTLTGNITQSNIGTGEVILSDPGTDDTFAFKSLVAGNGVTMIPSANDITVSSHVTMNNIGLGFSVLNDPGTDHDFSFKSLLGGTNINLSAVGNDVVINANQQTITLNHLGAGANVLAIPGTASTFGFKSLVQGTGIVISNGLNDITVSSNISQSNVGVGTGLILKNAGSGPSYEFKSLVAGSGISVTNGINDIILASSSTMNNLGAGTGVLVAPGGTITGTTFDFKTLVAGTGITFTTDLTTITINATPFAGITQNNVGAGTGLILKNTGTATSFDFKSLIAGTNVTLTNGTDDITLDVVTPNSNLANLGAGTAILATTGVQPVTNVRNFKSLVAGTNLSLSSDANTITINATSSTPNTTLSNLGAGEAVLSTTGTLPATTTRNFKTLLAGTNVTLSSDANSITINSTAVSPTSQGFSVEISNGAVPTIAVNPAYTKIAPFTTPSYGFNSGLLNTGTGVLTIGAGDVGTYNVEFNLMVSNSNATASSKNYIDVIFRNTTTGTNYINLTQDMPSNGNYTINFSKPFNLTAGDYEIQISKLRTGGTYTVYTTLKSGYAVYRIA
mgnify:CR=1 FL=1